MIRPAALLVLASAACLADDLVYVSAVNGGSVKQVLREVAARLKPAGLGLAHVASANLYVADASALPQAEAQWRKAFSRIAPARTVLLTKFPADTAVSISVIASRQPFRAIQGGGVLTAGTLFLPGLVARDTGVPIEEQTRDVMSQQQAILKAAGLTFADLVMTRIYLSEPAEYGGLNEAYKKFVAAPPPARATVHARPFVAGQRLQIQSVAVQGSGVNRPSGAGITSPIHSYSVRAGSRLYVTGMTGRRADGGFDRNDVSAQARVSAAAIEEQLQRHGMRFDDVVDMIVWLRDPADWNAVKEACGPMLRNTAFSVAGIPPNAPEALVEIAVVAESRPR